MWYTPLGHRYLAGRTPERNLFLYALEDLLPEVREERRVPIATGVPLYDSLPAGDQLVSLSHALNGLLRRPIKAKPISAIFDAAAAVGFLHLQRMIEGEMTEGGTWHRQLIEDHFDTLQLDTSAIPSDEWGPWFDDAEVWCGITNQLVARVAWRCTPAESAELANVAVEPERFHDAPDAPATDREVEAALHRLNRLVPGGAA